MKKGILSVVEKKAEDMAQTKKKSLEKFDDYGLDIGFVGATLEILDVINGEIGLDSISDDAAGSLLYEARAKLEKAEDYVDNPYEEKKEGDRTMAKNETNNEKAKLSTLEAMRDLLNGYYLENIKRFDMEMLKKNTDVLREIIAYNIEFGKKAETLLKKVESLS